MYTTSSDPSAEPQFILETNLIPNTSTRAAAKQATYRESWTRKGGLSLYRIVLVLVRSRSRGSPCRTQLQR